HECHTWQIQIGLPRRTLEAPILLKRIPTASVHETLPTLILGLQRRGHGKPLLLHGRLALPTPSISLFSLNRVRNGKRSGMQPYLREIRLNRTPLTRKGERKGQWTRRILPKRRL